ncbi:hypothetical protein TYRP_005741 [Tyrophagus putrescentiae]|nr:hypothetical protein TYRP_005741 [Tyrophagus putrescentiae]
MRGWVSRNSSSARVPHFRAPMMMQLGRCFEREVVVVLLLLLGPVLLEPIPSDVEKMEREFDAVEENHCGTFPIGENHLRRGGTGKLAEIGHQQQVEGNKDGQTEQHYEVEVHGGGGLPLALHQVLGASDFAYNYILKKFREIDEEKREPVRLEDQPRDKGHLLHRVEEVQVKVADGVEGRPVEAQSRTKEKKWMKKMDGLIN